MNPTPDRAAPDAASETNETVARGSDTGAPLPPEPSYANDPVALGDYVVLRKIGEGGMGAVFLAEDRKLGRKAAVKTMKRELAADKANRDRFAREARAAAAVESDYIVPVWQIGEAADGTPYIAMPFLQGEMLDARLKREAATSVALVLKVALEVGHGLAAAHAVGLIHRDIKPGNIWLEGDPAAREPARQVRRCKVLDFGLARSAANDDANLTASGAILGTPAYMAPEQARGERLDHRADLFSLGVTLYRMATGRVPFRGANAMAVLIALATETPEPVTQLAPHLPPGLSALIDRLMSKNPADRPASAADVVAAVKQLVRAYQGRSAPSTADVSGSMPVVVVPAAPAANPWEEVTDTATAIRDQHEDEDDEDDEGDAPARRGLFPWVLGAVGAILLTAVVLLVLVVRGETANGTAALELADPQTEARLKSVQLLGADGKVKYTLTPGERSKHVAAGRYAVRLEGADGLTADARELVLKAGETATLRVQFAEPKPVAKKDPPPPKKKDDPPVPADPDRRAAAWVLSVGGWVSTSNGNVSAPAQIPAGPFVVTGIYLNENKQATAAGFDACAGLTSVVSLYAMSTGITDDGLAHFKGCKNLRHLAVYNTAVTDAGVAHLAGNTGIEYLAIGRSRVTDKGLAVFADCANLDYLDVQNLALTDGGFAVLANCRNLAEVRISGPALGDRALTVLSACPKLQVVYANGAPLTAAGVLAFAKARPACGIFWNGGTVLPSVPSDRAVAEFALANGGTVLLHGGTEPLARLDQLPGGDVRIAELNLDRARTVHEIGLRVCLGMRSAEVLRLSHPQLADSGLNYFQGCAGVRVLTVAGTQVTDDGLLRLPRHPDLVHLALARCRATDKGLVRFAGCSKLEFLDLTGLPITDDGFAALRSCRALTEVRLANTQIGDRTLALLRACPNLKAVVATRTAVTASGVAALAKALPDCKIMWDGGAP